MVSYTDFNIHAAHLNQETYEFDENKLSTLESISELRSVRKNERDTYF